MHHVIPAIIPESADHLEDVLIDVEPFTREVQIDIVDGDFVPFLSWPYVGAGSIQLLSRYTDAFSIEVDLMIAAPETVLSRYANAGVSSMVVHLESTRRLEAIFEHRDAHAYALGLSINNDTELSLLMQSVERADYVQLMGIAQIGSQGQPFDERVLKRIHTLRAAFPDLQISIDGSVNADTIPLLREAGANRFVSGSAILKAKNPRTAFRSLERLATARVSI